MLKDYINKENKLNRKEFIVILFLVAVISGIFGWVYEVLFYYLNSGFTQVYLRGGNYLPWINIYMYGSFLICFLTYRLRKHPALVFLVSAISTGILEYFSGLVLYGILGWVKCWDYNQEILNFGNISGYVCLRSVTVFGICGLLLIYFILPILIKLVKKGNIKTWLIISSILFAIFLGDEIYNRIELYNYLPIPNATEFYKSKGFKYIYFSD